MKKINDLPGSLGQAIVKYWSTRQQQADRQREAGRTDQGARASVTGGAHMNGFVGLVKDLIVEAGADPADVFTSSHLELPGFFRPTKEWDLLVVKDSQLIVALEMKSQVGPSFGNNFNNRTEEAMGSALDLWTAYREGAYNKTVKPWLGYLFMLEDCEASRKPVHVSEPHFAVLPEFKLSSYGKRYELFCRKLMRERHYDVAAFLLSDRVRGLKGEYVEPAEDMAFANFARSLVSQIENFGVTR
jgi:hypothetical protein